jgi:cation diffusion facilitator CzcD-associated flavoprotein CzcO
VSVSDSVSTLCMTGTKINRVAILGAGPAGGVALDAFLDHGIPHVRVFERRPVAGGTWAADEDVGVILDDNLLPPFDEPSDLPLDVPCQARTASQGCQYQEILDKSPRNRRFDEPTLYPQLETNILPDLMKFDRRSLPRDLTPTSMNRYGVTDTFRPNKTVKAFVDHFFSGDRAKYVSYNTTVEKAEQRDGPGSEWVLTLRHQVPGSATQEWWTETFDGLYVATGRNNVPRVSHIPGLKEAATLAPSGVVRHAKYFRNVHDFVGKKVLVIGAAITSSDIIHLIKDVSQTPIYLSMKSVLALQSGGFEQPFIDARGEVAEILVNEDRQTLDVVFIDKSVVRNIDRLILATGYKMSYPFLEEYGQKYGGFTKDNGLSNFYQTTWWSYDPSLVIAGVVNDGVVFRAMEAQAMATAGLWTRVDGSKFPSKEECLVWETERRKHKKPAQWHSWYPDYAKFLMDLTDVGGGYSALSRIARFDMSDHSNLNRLYEYGYELKARYWNSEANKWLAQHPEDLALYEQTKAFVQSRIARP